MIAKEANVQNHSCNQKSSNRLWNETENLIYAYAYDGYYNVIVHSRNFAATFKLYIGSVKLNKLITSWTPNWRGSRREDRQFLTMIQGETATRIKYYYWNIVHN